MKHNTAKYSKVRCASIHKKKKNLFLVVSETIEKSEIHTVRQMEIGISLLLPIKMLDNCGLDLQPNKLPKFHI